MRNKRFAIKSKNNEGELAKLIVVITLESIIIKQYFLIRHADYFYELGFNILKTFKGMNLVSKSMIFKNNTFLTISSQLTDFLNETQRNIN
jgi:hypothetical protein